MEYCQSTILGYGVKQLAFKFVIINNEKHFKKLFYESILCNISGSILCIDDVSR